MSLPNFSDLYVERHGTLLGRRGAPDARRVIDPAAGRSARAPTAFRAARRETRGEIYVYGPIGAYWLDGIGAKEFAGELKGLRGVAGLDLRINSDGGDVFEAKAMYTLLRDFAAGGAEITVHVDGIAASAASFLAMAGDEIRISEGAWMMVHNAWGLAIGDAGEMRRYADLLEAVSASIADTYIARSGAAAETVAAWMDAETYFDGAEAVAAGLADTLVEYLKVAAAIRHPEYLPSLPQGLRPNRAAASDSLAAIRAIAARRAAPPAV